MTKNERRLGIELQYALDMVADYTAELEAFEATPERGYSHGFGTATAMMFILKTQLEGAVRRCKVPENLKPRTNRPGNPGGEKEGEVLWAKET